MSSIPELVSTILAKFSDLEHAVEALEPSNTEKVQLHLSRFKLWAGGIGAHRPFGHRSLEYRLSGALMIRNHVIALLEDMCRYLKQGKYQKISEIVVRKDRQELRERPQHDNELLRDYFDDDESELDEYQQTLLQIQNVIECLMRLVVTIRNPAPHEQFMLSTPELVSFFDYKHLEHVQHSFPHLQYSLMRRLAKALTYRRVFLRYRKIKHGPSEELIEDDNEREGADNNDGIIAEESQLPGDMNQDSFSRPFEWSDDSSQETATSYAPSSAQDTELHVPQIPRRSADGRFLCPCCYLRITVKDWRKWEQHVFSDLRPYICLVDSCHLIDNGFSQRKDWLDHMIREHWRIWICPFGCADCFTTLPLFSKHLSQDHGKVASTPDIKLHTRISMNLEQGGCPLCREHKILSSHHYQSHVGSHLEQLVLFVLPGAEDTEETRDVEEGIHSEPENHQSDDDSQPVEHGRIRPDQETGHSGTRFESAVRIEVEKWSQENDRLRAEKAMESQHIQKMIDLGVTQRLEEEERRKAEEQQHDEQVIQRAVEMERARVKADENEKTVARLHDKQVAEEAMKEELARKEATEKKMVEEKEEEKRREQEFKDRVEEAVKEELARKEAIERKRVEEEEEEERREQEFLDRVEVECLRREIAQKRQEERDQREREWRQAHDRRVAHDARVELQKTLFEEKIEEDKRKEEQKKVHQQIMDQMRLEAMQAKEKKEREDRQREFEHQNKDDMARRAVEDERARERLFREQERKIQAEVDRLWQDHVQSAAETRRREDDLRRRQAEASRLRTEARRLEEQACQLGCDTRQVGDEPQRQHHQTERRYSDSFQYGAPSLSHFQGKGKRT